MFNTALRLYYSEEHERMMLSLEDAWIPTCIEGDDLSHGHVMTSGSPRSKRSEGSIVSLIRNLLRPSTTLSELESGPIIEENDACEWFRFKIDDDIKHQRLIVAEKEVGEDIESQYGAFDSCSVTKIEVGNGGPPESLIIECFLPHRRLEKDRVTNTAMHQGDDSADQVLRKERMFKEASHRYRQATRILYVLDESLGSNSSSGYKGRGARFIILESNDDEMRVTFDCPLTFWKPSQRDLMSQLSVDRVMSCSIQIQGHEIRREHYSTIAIRHGKSLSKAVGTE
ncbi:uncharacterized protein N0V89_011459 [Didymosphaeria variabile]|uniref:Uncharacterized protein n=1 Tax=Didymosphaeria variabile TaxID=1932322 RepID=A0A9W8XA09_9PLEO|nr:uncharacterized protein N0V89_011459 [Didymosphaeria variabile]KAJ4345329.1 hypothetical protein N0V89_011459 [Didymosphaeria variabile]